MKAHDLIGKRIVAIRQTRVPRAHGGPATRLDAIELEGGDVIRFLAFETEDLPGVQGLRIKRRRP